MEEPASSEQKDRSTKSSLICPQWSHPVLRPEKGNVPSVLRHTPSSSLPPVPTQDQPETAPAFEGLGGACSGQDLGAQEVAAGDLRQAAPPSVCVCLVAQSCLTLCNPMDCSPPDSSVHGILQAIILEWVAMPFSRGSSQPRN